MFFKGRARYRKTANLSHAAIGRAFTGKISFAFVFMEEIKFFIRIWGCLPKPSDNGPAAMPLQGLSGLPFGKYAFEFKKSNFIEIEPGGYVDITRSQQGIIGFGMYRIVFLRIYYR